jgi:quinone-modifying oxidoreductase subunit QmoA
MSASRKVLVIGGGISGISAAVEASEAGAEVLLVEKNPYLGGRVAQMNLYFPKLCPPACGLEINLRRFRTSPRIRYLTEAEVTEIKGEPGNFQVSIKQKPRLINEKCTACGACAEACPVERPDAFNCNMAKTKAAYLPFPTAYPLRFVIDSEYCKGTECGKCVEVCDYQAIALEAEEKIIEENVSAVIVATGWKPFQAETIENLSYNDHENIITNLQMERLAAPDGPTGGKLVTPSSQGPLETVAFVQCAGSRDENYLKHCSGVCCLASLKQARYVREQYPEAQIYIFYIDLRAPGRLEDFLAESETDEKLKLIKGKVARISKAGSDGKLVVEAEDVLGGRRVRQRVDLVVLATGMVPAVPEAIDHFKQDDDGFLVADEEPSALLAAGCVRRPVDVAESVRDATAAALKAIHWHRG